MKPRIVTLALVLFVLTSCFKEDIVRPTIRLLGPSTMEFPIRSEFKDPGFLAQDNRDGDISRFVTISGIVNTEVTGLYQLNYNVRDAAGNEAFEQTRLIYIQHHPGALAGVYYSSDNCQPVASYFTVFENIDQHNIRIKNLMDLPDSVQFTAYLRGITGQGIVLNETSYGDTVYSGTGEINSTGSEITLEMIKAFNQQEDTCIVSLTTF